MGFRLRAMKFLLLPLGLSLALGSRPETAAGRVNAMIGITQNLPFPGKRRAAGDAATHEAMSMAAEAKAYELTLTEQVYSAWWTHHLSQVNLRITGDTRELLKTVEETALPPAGDDTQAASDFVTTASQPALPDGASPMKQAAQSLATTREIDQQRHEMR